MRAWFVLLLLSTAGAFAQSASFVALGEAKSYPVEHSAAFVAASRELKVRGYELSEYHARVDGCAGDVCEISVYPLELDGAEYRDKSYRGCPLKFCASMTYSKRSRTIVRVVGWR
jgi:hypothetical protein